MNTWDFIRILNKRLLLGIQVSAERATLLRLIKAAPSQQEKN